MKLDKVKAWIDTYVDMLDGEFRQRVHTGEGCLFVPSDIFEALMSFGILQTITQDKAGCYFAGDYGQTFLQVEPIESDKQRKGVSLRIVDARRRKEVIMIYVQRMNLSEAKTFEELPESLKTQLLSLPYSAIVRPLIIADIGKHPPNISKLAVRYGVAYRTVYKWIYGV